MKQNVYFVYNYTRNAQECQFFYRTFPEYGKFEYGKF